MPLPLLISGLDVGKEVSFVTGTNPPTSSIRSIMRAFIAAVVATLPSELDQVSPLAIVSEESCLKYLASDSVSVKYLPSRVPVSISSALIDPLGMLSEFTVIVLGNKPVANFAKGIAALSLMSSPTIVPFLILLEVI